MVASSRRNARSILRAPQRIRPTSYPELQFARVLIGGVLRVCVADGGGWKPPLRHQLRHNWFRDDAKLLSFTSANSQRNH